MTQRRVSPAVMIAAILVLIAAASSTVSRHAAPSEPTIPVITRVAVSVPAEQVDPPDPALRGTIEEPSDAHRSSPSTPSDTESGGATTTAQSSVETPSPTVPEGTVVVAPEASSSAPGTVEEPLDLATALGPDSPVRPGGTILLRGGMYRGTFTSEIEGTQTKPIVVRSHPGEQAVLDGGSEPAATLTINGADTRFMTLEVAKTDPDRRSAALGGRPEGFARAYANGIDVFGPRTKLIDVVIRDHRNGVGLWQRAIDAEIRGAVVFNNGWVGPERTYGHGIYVQSREGVKRIRDSLVFNNFGYGIHAYGLNAHVDGLVIEGVTSFENGAPGGTPQPNLFVGTSEHPVNELTIRSNILYHRPDTHGRNLQVGFGDVINRSGRILDNVVLGGGKVFQVMDFETLVIERNMFQVERQSTEERFLVDLQRSSSEAVTPLAGPDPVYASNRNNYLDLSVDETGGAPRSFLLRTNGDREAHTFAEWQDATGADRQSTYGVERPSGTSVSIRPTGTGRAIITVLNWDRKRSLFVDLAQAGLPVGSSFEIRDAQNLPGEPVTSGTWIGDPVEVRLDTQDAAQPFGSGAHPVHHTPIDFGVFVLMPL